LNRNFGTKDKLFFYIAFLIDFSTTFSATEAFLFRAWQINAFPHC